MKQDRLVLVAGFHTTADAMAAEKYCKKAGIPGRMIPVPRSMSTGCGHAWACLPEYRVSLEKVLQKEQIEAEAIEELMLSIRL